MTKDKNENRLNLKTLEFKNSDDKKEKTKRTNNSKITAPNKNMIGIVTLIVFVCILLLFFTFRKKNPNYIVRDFYNTAKVDTAKAKEKYNEKTEFNKERNKILSSRFKYEILNTKETTTPRQKEDKIRIVEVRAKIYNVDKRKVNTEATSMIPSDLRVGSDKYNKEYIKNLRTVVKKAELKSEETTIKLKEEKGNWYIIDTGITDMI